MPWHFSFLFFGTAPLRVCFVERQRMPICITFVTKYSLRMRRPRIMKSMASSASISHALETLRALVPDGDHARLRDALEYMETLYGDRTLQPFSSVSLAEHARRTTLFLAEFCHDDDALIASILQFALRADDRALPTIDQRYGKTVRDMVSRLHLLSHLSTADWRKSSEDQRTMLVTVADDVRILLVAIAGVAVFQHFLSEVDTQYRQRLCRQSLQLFAPIAARLGIYALKYRLERGAFPECYPSDAALIASQLQRLHQEHDAFLHRTASSIRDFLREQGLSSEVMAREKQPFSIFQKMRTRGVSSLQKITDLFAVRVIVPEVQDCYQALGLLHRLGTPISHRFKDYISFPKPNGYQSLHTCIIGLPHAPPEIMVEVQIRTHAMHQEAEYGVAAHWLYKEGVARPVRRTTDLLASSDNGGDAEQKLVDHIYVLTPKGDIVELPDGAGPLDFAFHVHSDLGLKFKAARVNGSIAPLSHRLENGDVVEVQMHAEPRPALQWMEQLVSTSAKTKLRAYFFSHNRSHFLTRGRDAVNALLRERALPRLDASLSALATFDGAPLSTQEREDLLVKIGMGSVRTSSVLRHLALADPVPRRTKRLTPKRAQTKASATSRDLRREPDVIIEGSPLTMPFRYARCCSPDQMSPRPDRMIGVITRVGVITVHNALCRMIRSVHPDRRLPMRWSRTLEKKKRGA